MPLWTQRQIAGSRTFRCGNESLAEFRAVIVTIAVVEWHSMRLYSPCHEAFWYASDMELDQIGAYLGASWVGASPNPAMSHELIQ
ncbi:MAG: hypothetical protein NVS1B6_11580 [Steroidobacteraceae bacterium]